MLKCMLFGVIVPFSRWCGVRACELRSSLLGLLSVRTTCSRIATASAVAASQRPSPGSTDRP